MQCFPYLFLHISPLVSHINIHVKTSFLCGWRYMGKLRQLGDSLRIADRLSVFYRMIQPQVSRDVVDGGSVHVWLDLTSKMQTLLRFYIVKSNF